MTKVNVDTCPQRSSLRTSISWHSTIPFHRDDHEFWTFGINVLEPLFGSIALSCSSINDLMNTHPVDPKFCGEYP